METHVVKMAAKFRDQRTWMNADPQQLLADAYPVCLSLEMLINQWPHFAYSVKTLPIPSAGVEQSGNGNIRFQDGGQIQRPKEHR